MDEILKSLENLNLFLAGCAHAHPEGPVQTTFNAVRGDILKIRASLFELVYPKPVITGKEAVLSEN
jgi:hypothetical protein